MAAASAPCTDASWTEVGAPWRFIDTAVSYTGDECLFWPFATACGRGHLRRDGKDFMAHKVVCEQVHGAPPFAGAHAAHSCGNGHLGCVAPNHLRWATPAENAADKIEHGTAPRGENNGHAKLTADQVLEVRRMFKLGMSNAQIAGAFDVTDGAIRAIRNGRNWNWLE